MIASFPKTIGFLVLVAAGWASAETADVVGQGLAGPVVSADGARLIRSEKGINISLTMPTPMPGTYMYPDPNGFQPDVFQGHPEVFTGWAFIFNYPDQCSGGECGLDDLGPDKPAKGAAYNYAGHAVGGTTLRLNGRVDLNDEPFPAVPGAPLENPLGAEVHIAIAPHGALQPELLPTQITTPIGTLNHWWLALFQAP
jgi:hypothetical protein